MTSAAPLSSFSTPVQHRMTQQQQQQQQQQRARTTASAIRSRAKASLMSMSPFGRAVESRGLDSLRKLRISATTSSAKMRASSSRTKSHSKRCESGSGTGIKGSGSAVATPIVASEQDEDLFLCARLGQLLLRKNQELNGEVDSLKSTISARNEKIRDLESRDSNRENLHRKLVDSHRLLQEENLAQHTQLVRLQETVSDLEQRLARERAIVQQHRQQEQQQQQQQRVYQRKERAVESGAEAQEEGTEEEEENPGKENKIGNENSVNEALNVLKPRRESASGLNTNATETRVAAFLATNMFSSSSCQTIQGPPIKSDRMGDILSPTCNKVEAVRKVKVATTQTRKTYTRAVGIQTDEVLPSVCSLCNGSSSAAGSAAALDLSMPLVGPHQLPESQHELELLLKVILQSLFHKKLENQLEEAEGSLGEQGVLDPATDSGTFSSDSVSGALGIVGDNFFDFNFLEGTEGGAVSGNDQHPNEGDNSNAQSNQNELSETSPTTKRQSQGVDPELQQWYSDVFATELEDLQIMRSMRRLSAASQDLVSRSDDSVNEEPQDGSNYGDESHRQLTDGESPGPSESLGVELLTPHCTASSRSARRVSKCAPLDDREMLSAELQYSVSVSSACPVEGGARPDKASCSTPASSSSLHKRTTSGSHDKPKENEKGKSPDFLADRCQARPPTSTTTSTASLCQRDMMSPQSAPARQGLFNRISSPFTNLSARAIALTRHPRQELIMHGHSAADFIGIGNSRQRGPHTGITALVTFVLTILFSNLWRRRGLAARLVVNTLILVRRAASFWRA